MSAWRKYLIVSITVILLGGCSKGPWFGNEVPDATKLPSTLGLTLLADKDINPNGENVASPLAFQVILMSEDSKLLAADYDQLTAKEMKDVLGKNYIDHQDFTLLPGQYKYIQPAELDSKVRYVGIAAYYSQPNGAQWKKVLKLAPIGHNYQVLVHLHKADVDMRKESED
ncbi:type VI secretion system lipoprotein TssJ [Hafnia paralvei]|uniref:Type VI secretion lipoprotein, VC_A0113 family n=1 Tax=Hafnia alvei ATCC 51873 TaxID=1002364 RepID=G9YD84_HAFAL|nr:type VI secretion system lipoprotein TssJ [Hafnia alvei]AJR00289.1 Type VI secretion lipoprotein/VasD [Enterobacteriaceae bacterium bta3-1]EHM37964.1 type VI secretion lipoprotein, VC_A0113 family [Hafnia alvei ATCC 51873]QQE43951.1 type VI secretion system lipoprotein TssJ [Hafnia alvei]